MNLRKFYIPLQSEPLLHAGNFLTARGCTVVTTPSPEVTHLLLPVPTPCLDQTILEPLPKSITIFGGNLPANLSQQYGKIDLLQDEQYLAQNAAITAECALQLAQQNLPTILRGTQVLVLGWGRIGQCLAQLFRGNGAAVSVFARKESHRAIIEGLGYTSVAPEQLPRQLLRYRLLINTVPAMILSKTQLFHCRPDCVLLDLASVRGIESPDAIWARGLPGKLKPEASGHLIARTILRHCMKREETT